jgi:hypothetical protein
VIAPRLQSRPATPRPLDTPESAELVAEDDTLSVFLPEDNSSMSARARARVTENVQAAARYATAVDVRDARIASQIDAKRLDDFHKLFRQTQVAVEQSKAEATAIRNDLQELRSLSDHLGRGYARLGDICRLTEKRSDLTVDVLDAIEKRIEPLEIVRNLSTTENRFASLKQLAEEMMQSGARFEAQKEAIDRAREDATRVARLMDELQARVAVLTEKSEWLAEAEATVGRLEHRAVETTAQLERRATATIAELERRLDGFDGRKRAIVQALAAACTESDATLRQAKETVGWLEPQAAEITAQFERHVSHFEAQKHTIERALATVLTEGDQKLAQAQETVRPLEHQAVKTAAQLERRVRHFDAVKGPIERAAAVATRVTAVLSALETRVAALAGGDHSPGQAETAIGRFKRRIVVARVRVGQLVWSKSDVKYELERVRKRLHTLAESARSAVNVLRSAGASLSTAWKIEIRRPHLRWAAVLGVLVAVNLLGIVILLTPDQPGRMASNARAALQKSPARVPLLPSTSSHFAMFDMPAGRATGTTDTIAARLESSPDRRDGPLAAPAAQPANVSQAGRSKEPVQFVGALTVESDPAGSVVFVDRQLVGETPLELPGLRAGSHVVRIERDGFDRWTTAVLVAADKQTRVSARLQAVREP